MKNQLEFEKILQEGLKAEEAECRKRIKELEELLSEKFNKGFNQSKKLRK